VGCCCILVERARERRESRAREERQHLLKESMHPKARKQTARKNMPYHTDFWRSYSIKCAQKLRRTAAAVSESIGTVFKAAIQHLIGTEIEEGAGHVFLGKENPYSPYEHAQK
jgi:hypothetical protein